MEDKRIYVDKLFSIMGLWKKKALIMKNHIFVISPSGEQLEVYNNPMNEIDYYEDKYVNEQYHGGECLEGLQLVELYTIQVAYNKGWKYRVHYFNRDTEGYAHTYVEIDTGKVEGCYFGELIEELVNEMDGVMDKYYKYWKESKLPSIRYFRADKVFIVPTD